MPRLIDADELIYESIDSSDTARNEYYYGTGIVAIRKEDIDDAPTIDAVEVIRCKYCKYSSDNRVYGCSIESFDYDFDTQMYANDFCSCGKRRSNG